MPTNVQYSYLDILKAKHSLSPPTPISPWKHSRFSNPLKSMQIKHKKMIDIINKVIRLNNTGVEEVTTYVS